VSTLRLSMVVAFLGLSSSGCFLFPKAEKKVSLELGQGYELRGHPKLEVWFHDEKGVKQPGILDTSEEQGVHYVDRFERKLKE